MPCWFFMSYTRVDDPVGEDGVRTFYDDLKAAVSARVQDQTPPLAYLDRENLKPGDSWPDELADALGSCRTFVAIMTARYFTREYCGKEWAIFEKRSRSLGGSVLPPLIIPVLWVRPVDGELPKFATDLQMTFDPNVIALETERPLLAAYETYGLEHVMKRRNTSHANIYETILEQLAKRIIENAKAHPLPSLARSALLSLENAPNRFASAQPPIPGSGSAASRANFAFVAGTVQEMTGIRADAQKYYGPAGALDWMPYAPDEAEQIALIAQTAATGKRLIVNWLSTKAGLVDAIKQAEKENSVAIVIVDPWTARHPEYRPVLSQFDEFQFRNCVVLIPWNRSDAQTESARQLLRDDLRQTLSRSFDTRKDIYFRHDVLAKQLGAEISVALADLETLLAPYREPARAVESSQHKEPPQLNAAAG